jgi:hypothetical protein
MGTVYAAAKAPKEEREADGTKRTATETGCSAFTASSPSVSQSERFSIPSARLVCVYTSVTREAQRIHSPLCIKHKEGETKREREREAEIYQAVPVEVQAATQLFCVAIVDFLLPVLCVWWMSVIS